MGGATPPFRRTPSWRADRQLDLNFQVWLKLNSFSQNGSSHHTHKFNIRTFNMNTFDVLWVLHTTQHQEKQGLTYLLHGAESLLRS
jgi:hypothetical protein